MNDFESLPVEFIIEENKYLNWCLSFMIFRFQEDNPTEGTTEEQLRAHLKNAYESRKKK